MLEPKTTWSSVEAHSIIFWMAQVPFLSDS